jgi:hypothetical protein
MCKFFIKNSSFFNIIFGSFEHICTQLAMVNIDVWKWWQVHHGNLLCSSLSLKLYFFQICQMCVWNIKLFVFELYYTLDLHYILFLYSGCCHLLLNYCFFKWWCTKFAWLKILFIFSLHNISSFTNSSECNMVIGIEGQGNLNVPSDSRDIGQEVFQV